MLSLLALLTVTASFFGQLHAKPSFTRPPPFTDDSYQDNPKYDLGKNVTIAWRDMSDGMFELKLFIRYPRSFTDINDISWTIKSNITSTVTTTIWPANLGGREKWVGAGDNAICYLGLVPPTGETSYSAYFNVSIPDNLGTSTNTTLPEPTPTTSSSTRPDSDSTPKSSLSTGGLVGIAVGSVIGGSLIICGFVSSIWIHRRKKRDTGETNKQPPDMIKPPELEGTQRSELPSTVPELPSGGPKEAAKIYHELEG